MRSLRTTAATLVVGAAALALLGACSKSGDNANSTSSPAATDSGASAPAVPASDVGTGAASAPTDAASLPAAGASS